MNILSLDYSLEMEMQWEFYEISRWVELASCSVGNLEVELVPSVA